MMYIISYLFKPFHLLMDSGPAKSAEQGGSPHAADLICQEGIIPDFFLLCKGFFAGKAGFAFFPRRARKRGRWALPDRYLSVSAEGENGGNMLDFRKKLNYNIINKQFNTRRN